MKRLFLFLMIGLLTFGFAGCLKDKDPIYYYVDEPAIVSYENQNPVLRTAWGVFSAPNLSDTLKAGDCLWTNFTVDMNSQKSGLKQLTGLQYRKLGVDSVREISNMEDDFNDPIRFAALYNATVDSVLFFMFTQSTIVTYNETQTNGVRHYSNGYTYEILYNTDSTVLVNGRKIPKLYIKSKKIQTSGNVPAKCHFAFNMAEFVSKYADPASKFVPLYLHYKTGVSQDGKDIYRSFQTYPVKWKP